MAGSIEVFRRIPDAPALAIRKRFGSYKREAEKAERKAEVQESVAVGQVISAWDSLRRVSTCHNHNKDLEKATKHIHCTDEDIQRISILLTIFQQEYDFSPFAGRLLSALVNNGTDSDYVIPTGHLDVPLDRLCMDNLRNVRIEGSAGNTLAWHMKGGNVVVEGDVGNALGTVMERGSIMVLGSAGDMVGQEMGGGRITITGDAGRDVGYRMRHGMITVKGDAEYGLGIYMGGGKIIVEGNVGSFAGAGMEGGRIVVGGDAGYCLGNEMQSGVIRVAGEIEGTGDLSWHPEGRKRIYQKRKLRYRNG